MASPARVLVHLRSTPTNQAVLANFSQSVVNYLSDTSDTDELRVECELRDKKLFVSPAKNGALLRRPPFCPIKMLTEEDVKELPEDISSRGINVGVVAVLESSDSHVLVTRRAAHMRTFPGVWVPPGGGVDLEDTDLLQTALRELREETGLDLKDSIGKSEVLCLWESVYPHILGCGMPKRHHIVVYYHITMSHSHLAMDKEIKLDPEEVDASAWLSEKHVDVLVNGLEKEGVLPEGVEKTFKTKMLDDKKEMKDVDCPSEVLFTKAPVKGSVDVERFSTGTRFALSEWLKKRKSEERNSKL